MVIISSSGRWASVTTTAVISLVSEAMGSTACEFLLNRTSFVSWSSTSATPGLQVERVGRACRPDQLAERRLGRLDAGQDDGRNGHGASCGHEHLPGLGAGDGRCGVRGGGLPLGVLGRVRRWEAWQRR